MVVDALRRTDQLDDTYLVFTSDHGFHMGNHRLRAGKDTPYVIDSHVPFAIRGPGIGPARSWAGSPDRWMSRRRSRTWRASGCRGSTTGSRCCRSPRVGRRRRGGTGSWCVTAAGRRLCRHPRRAADARGGHRRRRQPAFRGVLGSRWRYVRYGGAREEEELYDHVADPHQVRNIMARPARDRTEEQQAALQEARRAVRRLTGCSGVVDCRVGSDPADHAGSRGGSRAP